MKDDLEKNIKNKLEARRIQPSKSAWNTLENELNQTIDKPRKNYWWIGIAAGFVFGIIISTYFYNHRAVDQQQKIVVRQPNAASETVISKYKNDAKEKIKPESEKQVKQAIAQKVSANVTHRATVSTAGKTANTDDKTTPAKKTISDNKVENNLNTEADEMLKTAIVSENVNAKSENDPEELLRKAQFKIRGDKAMSDKEELTAFRAHKLLQEVEEERNKINPHNLLREVEIESQNANDKSLQDEVVDILKIGFKKATKKIADR